MRVGTGIALAGVCAAIAIMAVWAPGTLGDIAMVCVIIFAVLVM